MWLLMLTCRKKQHFFVLNTHNSKIRVLSLQTIVVTQRLLMLLASPCTENPANSFPPHLHYLLYSLTYPASKQSPESGSILLPALKAILSEHAAFTFLERLPCLGCSIIHYNIILLKAHVAPFLFRICGTKRDTSLLDSSFLLFCRIAG